MWVVHNQYEDIRIMLKAQQWSLVKVGAEDDGDYRLALLCLSGGDVG